ncbi:lytic transglycosylase domain-containing protein [[Pantoea] beijingensis]|nr:MULTISPECIES: transglycosylase SLT domain-containing protein [Erwiniaceae]
MNINGLGAQTHNIPLADHGQADGGGNHSGAVSNNNNPGDATASPHITTALSGATGSGPINFDSPPVFSVNAPAPNNAAGSPTQPGPEKSGGSLESVISDILNQLSKLIEDMKKKFSIGDHSGQTSNTPAAPSGGNGSPTPPIVNGGGGPSVGHSMLVQPGSSGGAKGADSAGATSGASGLSGSGDLHLPPQLEPYRQSINHAAKVTGMPASVIAAQIWAESRGNLSAASTNGGNGKTDSGLMQVNPDTYNEMKNENPGLLSGNPNSAENNIMAGALYLKQQTHAFNGNIGAGLRAYNSGPDNVNLSNLSDISKTGTGASPYVDNVLSYAKIISSGQGKLPA